MTSYTLIRLGNILVPASTTRFGIEESEAGPIVTVHTAGHEPLTFDGTAAEAFKAFIEGTLQFPVNTNGVLDLPAGWRAAEPTRAFAGRALETARETFGLDNDINGPYISHPEPYRGNPPLDPRVAGVMNLDLTVTNGPAGPPRLDVNKIKERIGVVK